MSVNVDTKLPVNNIEGVPIGDGPDYYPYAPYVGWGDSFDSYDGSVSQIITDAGGTNIVAWDVPLNVEYFPNTISFKEDVDLVNGDNYYRNADNYAGELLIDLPAPTKETENLSVITVYVDPLTHAYGSDILPQPSMSNPGVVWIDGERIEYRQKVLIAPNTWQLKLVRRGTLGTGITSHLAMVPEVDEVNVGPNGETILVDPPVYVPNKVFVELNNTMPPTSVVNIWNLLGSSVPAGGIWYADTLEAEFLKDNPGKSIP